MVSCAAIVVQIPGRYLGLSYDGKCETLKIPHSQINNVTNLLAEGNSGNDAANLQKTVKADKKNGNN